MEEKQEKEKGNFWLTVASFIVNKRKAIEILFVLAIIYSVLSINKVQVIRISHPICRQTVRRGSVCH